MRVSKSVSRAAKAKKKAGSILPPGLMLIGSKKILDVVLSPSKALLKRIEGTLNTLKAETPLTRRILGSMAGRIK